MACSTLCSHTIILIPRSCSSLSQIRLFLSSRYLCLFLFPLNALINHGQDLNLSYSCIISYWGPFVLLPAFVNIVKWRLHMSSLSDLPCVLQPSTLQRRWCLGLRSPVSVREAMNEWSLVYIKMNKSNNKESSLLTIFFRQYFHVSNIGWGPIVSHIIISSSDPDSSTRASRQPKEELWGGGFVESGE